MRIWVFDHFWKSLGFSHFECWLHSFQSLRLTRCVMGLLILSSASPLLFHILFISLRSLLCDVFTALFQFTESRVSWLILLFNHLFHLFQG